MSITAVSVEEKKIRCTLCSLDFANAEQCKQHVEGKKHARLAALRDEREQSARRSLFVSNLRRDTFVKQLEDHFVKFGTLRKLVTDPEKNAYAIVEYESEMGVEEAMSRPIAEHTVNGRQLKVSRRELKEFVSKISANNERKKDSLERLREEALTVNKILGKCGSVMLIIHICFLFRLPSYLF